MKKIIVLFSFLLIFILFFSINSYAGETSYPDFSHLLVGEYNYYTVHKYKYNDGSYAFYLGIVSSDSPLTGLKVAINGDSITFYNNYSFDVTFKGYMSNYGTQAWEVTSSSPIAANSYRSVFGKFDGSISNIFESNVNIYSSVTSEEIFFQGAPIPTSPTLEEVVAEEIPATASKIIQTMKIILLCGVGCLALLVALPILLKVLYRFL